MCQALYEIMKEDIDKREAKAVEKRRRFPAVFRQ